MLGCKVICVRYINCPYNNVAKDIRLLDKKSFLFIQEKFHASKSFWKIYPLNVKFVFTWITKENNSCVLTADKQLEKIKENIKLVFRRLSTFIHMGHQTMIVFTLSTFLLSKMATKQM